MNKLELNKKIAELSKLPEYEGWTKEQLEAEAIKTHEAEQKVDTAEVAVKEENKEQKTEEVKKTKEQTVPLSVVEKLIADALEKERKNNEQKFAKSDTSDDDDDYMEEPATFFMYVHAHSLFSYKLKNREVFPPYSTKEDPKPISFTHSFKKKSRFGNGDIRIIQVCSFTTRSKKEIKFIEQSPDYNIRIFRKLSDATTVDIMLADKMADANKTVSIMNQFEVIERCRTIGLPISSELDDMKRRLIINMAEQAMKQDIERHIRMQGILSDEKRMKENPVHTFTDSITSENIEKATAEPIL